jgi:hypothetical protein
MVQIRLFVLFILAAAAVVPIAALPKRKSHDDEVATVPNARPASFMKKGMVSKCSMIIFYFCHGYPETGGS